VQRGMADRSERFPFRHGKGRSIPINAGGRPCTV
jgi:hypothetical protein